MNRPRFQKGDEVCFFENGEEVKGRVVNVDIGGALGVDEHSYDIYIEDEDVIWKHVEQSAIGKPGA